MTAIEIKATKYAESTIWNGKGSVVGTRAPYWECRVDIPLCPWGNRINKHLGRWLKKNCRASKVAYEETRYAHVTRFELYNDAEAILLKMQWAGAHE